MENEFDSATSEMKYTTAEQAYIRVPFECGVREFRTLQKQVEHDLHVLSTFIEKKILLSLDPVDILQKLDKIIEKTSALKEKIVKNNEDIDEYLNRCNRRLNLLETQNKIQADHWKTTFDFDDYTTRIDWILLEYLLRQSLFQTSCKISDDIKWQGLLDPEILDMRKKVVDDLRNHSTAEALQWCTTHKSRLKKINSPLGDHLIAQHALGLIVGNKTEHALKYLQTNTSESDFGQCPQLRKVIALLAFGTEIPTFYQEALGEDRWETLVELFEQNLLKLYGYPSSSSVNLLVLAGFSALKSQVCHEHKHTSCPACSVEWEDVVKNIPVPHRVQSCLICPITGDVMDAENPPMASPDGHVYSQNAIQALARESPDGMVEFPGKKPYPLDKFTRVFVT